MKNHRVCPMCDKCVHVTLERSPTLHKWIVGCNAGECHYERRKEKKRVKEQEDKKKMKEMMDAYYNGGKFREFVDMLMFNSGLSLEALLKKDIVKDYYTMTKEAGNENSVRDADSRKYTD